MPPKGIGKAVSKRCPECKKQVSKSINIVFYIYLLFVGMSFVRKICCHIIGITLPKPYYFIIY